MKEINCVNSSVFACILNNFFFIWVGNVIVAFEAIEDISTLRSLFPPVKRMECASFLGRHNTPLCPVIRVSPSGPIIHLAKKLPLRRLIHLKPCWRGGKRKYFSTEIRCFSFLETPLCLVSYGAAAKQSVKPCLLFWVLNQKNQASCSASITSGCWSKLDCFTLSLSLLGYPMELFAKCRAPQSLGQHIKCPLDFDSIENA